jgi:enamine deaminase RidA (YjgF/YER057c/UK114 family)
MDIAESANVRSAPTFREINGQFSIAALNGADPVTGAQPPSPEAQFQQAFANLIAVLRARDLSPEEVGRVTVLTPDRSYRPFINAPWLSCFPGPGRPARRTTHVPLPAGEYVELVAVGVRGARRTALEIEGVRHKDPLPMGALLGSCLYSSAIVADAPSGTMPNGIDAIRQAFGNLTSLLSVAGGTLADVAHVSVYLGRWDLHDDMVDTWVETWPDDRSRPTRKTFWYPSVSIQLHCDAILGGHRANYEIEGLGHRDPIPMGAVTGGMFTTSGIDGRDPATGRAPRHVGPQARQALANLRSLLATARLGPDDLLHVDALVGQLRYSEEVLAEWRAVWPDPGTSPTLQVTDLGLVARDFSVQFIGRGQAPAGPRA